MIEGSPPAAPPVLPAGTPSSPWLSVWRRPRETIAQVVASEPRRYVLLIAVLTAIGSLVAEVIALNAGGHFLDWRIALAAIVFAAIFGILGLYAAGFVFRLCAKPFGGCAAAQDVRAAVAWSQLPYLALAVISLVAFGAATLLGIASQSTTANILAAIGWAFALWMLVLLGLMLARVQGFGFWRAAGSTSLGFFVLTILAVITMLAIRVLLFQPFSIPSASMLPTLRVGDYMFVSKSAYGYSRHALPFAPRWFSGRFFAREPRRGDIVVFALPHDERAHYVKRVIGLPGERMRMIGGVLHINGTPVPREAVGDFSDPETQRGIKRYRETLPNGVRHETLDVMDNAFFDNTAEFVVPAGHYFVMGDNRDNSTDSRALNQVGFIPFENLIGRASFVYYSRPDATDEDPFRRFGWIAR